jgi:membrane protease YdiL (CAAX protease family)
VAAAAVATPKPWGFVAFFAGVGGYYLLTLLLTGLMSGKFTNFDPTDPPRLGPLVLLAFAPNLLLGLGPAVLSWWRGAGLRRDFGIIPTWQDVKIGLSCGGFALLASWLLTLLLMRVHGGLEERSPLESFSALSGGQSVWLALVALFLVLGAPLTEELLVRGALWGALEHYRIPRWAILALTALVFAYLHEESWRTLSLFAQGLAIGAARLITGRIGSSMVAHATNNLVAALALFFTAT